MELREKLLVEINSALASVGEEKGWHWAFDDVAEIADRILALPEVADALKLVPVKGMTIPNVGHSISTGTKRD